jgi:hypothetical protein
MEEIKEAIIVSLKTFRNVNQIEAVYFPELRVLVWADETHRYVIHEKQMFEMELRFLRYASTEEYVLALVPLLALVDDPDVDDPDVG